MRRLLRTLLGLLLLVSLILPAQARPVTVNDNFRALKKASVLLYDLPEDGDRDRTLAYIREMHGYFFSQMELIDVRRTPRTEWSSRLGAGFLLYGVMATGSLTSEVLTHTYGSLQLSPGRLETPMFQGAGKELRFISVARNPFGPGPVTVYAAEQNALLHGINDAFHGPQSYHLFTRNKTLQEGTFNESFQRIPSDLPLAAAREDARVLFESLERIHPNLLAKLPRSRYEALRREVDTAIAAAAIKGRVPVRELASILYRATAAFQDGHTSLSWQYRPNGLTDAETRYPSFRLEYRNGRFVVGKTLGMAELEGLEVVSIEGKPTQAFLAPILDRCSGELMAFKAQRFDDSQTFYWSLTRLLGDRKRLSLSLRGSDGQPRRIHVPTVPLETFEQLDADRPERPQALTLRFPRPEVAYVSYPSFDYSQEQIQAINGVFRAIAARKLRALIWDLRGNGGGNSAMSDVILSHLTRQKVRQFSRIDLKVSPESIEARSDWFDEAIPSIGQVMVATSSLRSLPKVPNSFSGRLYVLTDAGTFSSAADFAAMVKGFRLGTLVGYETGGLAHSFGDVLVRYLPNSDIRYGVSCKEFYAPVPKPGDDRHGVRPDVAITDAMLKPYASSADPLLAFTVDRARR